jgi:methionyl-tRNA formyltransferase
MIILFMGMLGEFSLRPLAALLEAGATVCAVLVPDSGATATTPQLLTLPKPDHGGLPVVSGYPLRNVVTLAWEHNIPVYEVGSLSHPDLLAFQPDVIAVSCFPKILPPSLLNLPKLGALNLHPSLLPKYRGPEPLFWQFRNGETRTGVTLHFMNERPDTGDILLQTEAPFADGITGAEAERLCALAGSRLMGEGVKLLSGGNPPRQKQNESEATYFPNPTRADFVISTDQPARQALNFMRGANGWRWPFEICAGDHAFHVREAIDFSPDAVLGEPYRIGGDELQIQFSPGVLRLKCARKAPTYTKR